VIISAVCGNDIWPFHEPIKSGIKAQQRSDQSIRFSVEQFTCEIVTCPIQQTHSCSFKWCRDNWREDRQAVSAEVDGHCQSCARTGYFKTKVIFLSGMKRKKRTQSASQEGCHETRFTIFTKFPINNFLLAPLSGLLPLACLACMIILITPDQWGWFTCQICLLRS
jgi:hypothetical protein